MAELPRSDVSGRTSGRARASGSSTPASPGRDDPGAGYSMWIEEGFSGWAWFTGGLFGLVGLFQIITGTAALAGTGYHEVPSRNLVVDAGYSTWGWVHLVLGLVMVVTGGGMAFGSTVAVYAITVHGGEPKQPR
jgi:hypothetical protein